jgi:two-component system response regulator GlrR
VLLIEDDGFSIEPSLEVDSAESLAIDHEYWHTFRPDALKDWRGHLIVAVALKEQKKIVELFRWLPHHPIQAGTVAVLPELDVCESLDEVTRAADDFVIWPAREGELRERIRRIIGHRTSEIAGVEDRLTDELGLAELVGRSASFVQIVRRIPKLARSNCTVLITGETGTGKELCARAIHCLGPRRTLPFIAVDCGAFPEQLFENEMYGHARGAFTDAHRDQKGIVALAEGGTILLDEIDSLSMPSQAKLLRFLQERTYKPLGAEQFARADVNVLAATNRDLEALVREGRFRPDLFFRLSVLRVHMAPLRERREDIGLLARHFLNALCTEHDVPQKTLGPAAARKLASMAWPGNVRELRNVMERAVVFGEGPEISPDHLDIAAFCGGRDYAKCDSFKEARERAIAEFERVYVAETLERFKGNVTQAARFAQKDRRAFGRLLKRHNLSRVNFSG